MSSLHLHVDCWEDFYGVLKTIIYVETETNQQKKSMLYITSVIRTSLKSQLLGLFCYLNVCLAIEFMSFRITLKNSALAEKNINIPLQ